MPGSSVVADALSFAVAGAASLGASALLASRIERAGSKLRISAAFLGLVAALAADSPEITSSITALGRGQHAVGVGVVLGSNVFNLAALIGLGSIAAGRIRLHRRAIALEGAVALWVAASALLAVGGLLEPTAALAMVLAVLLPYVAAIALPARVHRRAGVPPHWLRWLELALREEEAEMASPPAPRRLERVTRAEVATAAASLVVVVGASIAMEDAGVAMGHHFHLSGIVTGGILLAAVTSLPNAVAAVHLARRGRGTAVLSEAANSNTLNVAIGLLVPGALVGFGAVGGQTLEVAWWYAGLTAALLAVAYLQRGVDRRAGLVTVVAYGVFAVLLVVR